MSQSKAAKRLVKALKEKLDKAFKPEEDIQIEVAMCKCGHIKADHWVKCMWCACDDFEEKI